MLIFAMGLMIWFGRIFARLRKRTASHTDKRVRLTSYVHSSSARAVHLCVCVCLVCLLLSLSYCLSPLAHTLSYCLSPLSLPLPLPLPLSSSIFCANDDNISSHRCLFAVHCRCNNTGKSCHPCSPSNRTPGRTPFRAKSVRAVCTEKEKENDKSSRARNVDTLKDACMHTTQHNTTQHHTTPHHSA